MATRRAELAQAATDYAFEHGLIGLSLRPLAEVIGTSDRMLLYHFRDKDDLVTTILQTANGRSVATLRQLPASRDLRTAVLDLWRAVSSGDQQACQRLYLEAAALGLFGREPYASQVRDVNASWMGAVAEHFVRAGLGRAAARRVAYLVDSTFMGLQLDETLDSRARVRRTVSDLADSVAAQWAPSEAPRPSAPQGSQPGRA